MELLDGAEFCPHRFTLQVMLGAPLLNVIGSKGGIISLARASSTGKTTAARIGLSLFGRPDGGFEINPTSTEKAFYEKLRIANNLPLICNEAATLDTTRIQNLAYAITNGESRATLTQTVQLRA